ncbi:MAG TPA: Trm112 family protein [Geobacteraceae bacterium]
MALSKELLAILACPKCKGKVTLPDDGTALVCPACSLKYPIRDGIPVMLVDEAEKTGNE